MATRLTLTAANSVFMLAIPGLYPVPQKLQGYAADSAFEIESTEGAEVMKGVDNILSAGWTPTIKQQTVSLQADSPSAFIFEAWVEAQDAQQELIAADGIIILPSIGREYTLTTGYLTRHQKMPGVRKILQPRAFVISWSEIIPAPLNLS